MKLIPTIVLAILACSCAPRATVVVPTAPPKASAVAPVVETVKKSASETATVSAKLEDQVASLREKTTDLRQDISITLAEAERLRRQKAASEEEMEALWVMLQAADGKVRILFDEAEAARLTADQQRDLRRKLEQEISDLAVKASARDAEAETLRSQREDLAKAVQAATTETDRANTALAKSEKEAAVGTYLRRWVSIGVVTALLIAASIAYLKFLRP